MGERRAVTYRCCSSVPRAARPRAGPRAGRGARGRHARPRRPRRGGARGAPEVTLVGLDRDPQALALRGRAAGARSPTGRTSCTPSTTSCPRCSTGWTIAAVERRPVRPRCLVAAARRGRPRVRLRPGRAAGHADGPDAGDHGRGGGQHLQRTASWPGCCGSTARRGSPSGSRRPSCGSGRRRRLTSSARLAELVRDADPGSGPADRRTSGEAHVPGAAHRGQRGAGRAARRRCRRRSTRSRRAGGWWCCPTTRWRTGSSSRPSPSGRAPPRRSTCRSSCRAPGRRCGCSPEAAEHAERGGGRGEPAGRVGAAAGRGTGGPGGNRAIATDEWAAAARAEPRPPRRPKAMHQPGTPTASQLSQGTERTVCVRTQD